MIWRFDWIATNLCVLWRLQTRNSGETKLLEFLQGEPLNLIFSMKTEDRQSYQNIREALLLCFNYTTEGLHRRFCEYIPVTHKTNSQSTLQTCNDSSTDGSNLLTLSNPTLLSENQSLSGKFFIPKNYMAKTHYSRSSCEHFNELL